jgi:putative drug exporter of the RND superfamily
MAELLYRIGRFASARRLAVVATWVTILVIVAGAFLAFGRTPAGNISIPGTPTALVAEHLAEAIPEAAGANGTVVFATEDGEPFSDEQKTAIAEAVARANQVDGVVRAVDPFATQAERDAQAPQLADGPAQLEMAQQFMASGQDRIDAGKAELADGQAQLDAAREQLVQEQAALDAAKAAPDVTQDTLDQLALEQDQLDATRATLDARQQEIDDGLAGIAEQQANLDSGAATLEAQAQQLEYGTALRELSSAIRLVSEDGSAAVAAVVLERAELPIPAELRDEIMAAFMEPHIDGVKVDFDATIASELPDLLGPGELLGVVIAAIVLFIMLGTLIGAGLPIVTALLGVAIGALGALTFAGTVEMVSVTPVLGVMLGLAVGIDYALFIINRHRHQLKDGYTVEESIPLANGTSGNAVLFAGSTVFIALLALNLSGIGFLGLMGTVGAVSVAIAVLIAITLTPALLSYVGMRILRRGERDDAAERQSPAPRKPARPFSNSQAIALALVGIIGLLILAIPAADLRLGLPLGAADSPDSTQHQAYDLTEEKFGAGANGPLVVVADLPVAPTEDELLGRQVAIAQRLGEFSDVAAVAPVGASDDRTVLAFQVLPAEGPTSVSTEELVRGLRAASPIEDGVAIGVAGQTSGNIDISQRLADALPLYLLVVVGLSLFIMVGVFRSIVVPFVATGGFVLSFFATIGGVVAIYQWGWMGDLFGVATPGPVLNFLPTILVGVLFGLAMDYMLFLATGMREAYVHGAPSRTAVVLGLRAGRSVVIAAAIIMISVFGAFVLSDSAIIRPIGFALAFGVAVDAFIVRLLIMPALMTLAGDWAWWVPRWMDPLIPNLDVEGATLERRHPHVDADHLAPGKTGPETT